MIIVSKIPNPKYRYGWDRIFGNKNGQGKEEEKDTQAKDEKETKESVEGLDLDK